MRITTSPQAPSKALGAISPFTPLRQWASLGLLATALSLGACSREETAAAEKKVDAAVATAEQKVDTAVAKAEQKIDEASSKAGQKADEMKADAKQGMDDVKQASAQAADKLGKKVNDAAITTAMNAELAKDATLSALAINVDTVDGRVALKGTAPNEAARQRASQLASAISGVRSVDNSLVVNTGNNSKP
jgi:hyperosmotically inducible periplasmic protein